MNKKGTRFSFSYIAVNSLTFYRLVASVLLLYFILERQTGLFKWFLAISFFTDAIDGYLARRFKVVSVLGAKMDSMADDLTVLVGMVGLYFFKPDFLAQNALYFFILLGLFILQVAMALIRYRRFTSFHTLSAKVAAVLQGSFLILIFFLPQPPMLLFYVAVAATAIDLIEEIILVLWLPEWQVDVKGIYWAMKERKDKGR
jgi:phosphatidylglycerophosphate synthase